MSQNDTAHAWWSRLRHQGLLLSPVVLLDENRPYHSAAARPPFYMAERLRNAYTRFQARLSDEPDELEQSGDPVLDRCPPGSVRRLGRDGDRAREPRPQQVSPLSVRIGSGSQTLRPHRVVFADPGGKIPALLVMADTSPQVGRGRGRTAYSRFLELLRGTGHRLGLLTNGHQFRLVYAGLDFESWCEWETDRWFDDGEGTEELAGLRQLLSPESLEARSRTDVSGLLDAVEESRKRQADLSSVLRENVRQAVEFLLEEVSTDEPHELEPVRTALVAARADRPLPTPRPTRRCSRPRCGWSCGWWSACSPSPATAAGRSARSTPVLRRPVALRTAGGDVRRTRAALTACSTGNMAWPRLMALFRLIHGGSAHGSFMFPGLRRDVLFRPGEAESDDPVARALHILEHSVSVCDATIYAVLRKLLRGPLPVMRGRAKTFVEGPVDYTDLRTEFIGLIYEGMLDYRLKRTDDEIGPQVFLNLGREPVLPLARLEDMLADDKNGPQGLADHARKEKVTATSPSEDEGWKKRRREAGGPRRHEEVAPIGSRRGGPMPRSVDPAAARG